MKHLRRLVKNEKGIAGIEAAILVLSFFVVSSVLGLTVMQLGLSTSATSTSAVTEHLSSTLPAMRFKGNIFGTRGGDGLEVPYYVDTIVVPVVTYASTPLLLDANSLVITYHDKEQIVADLLWSARWIRADDTKLANYTTSTTGADPNDLLFQGELVELTLHMKDLNPRLHASTAFTVEFKPLEGDVTNFRGFTPPILDTIIVFQ